MVSRLRVCLTHTILFALSTCFAASADSHSISKRSIQDDLDAIKGGVLLKNGKQTSCELGLIDSKSAFVMSQCFDFVNNAVDLTSKYEVLLDTGLDGKAARYTVESIYVHPNTMGANTGNDVSVIQFNSAGQVEWLNTIGTMPELNWDSMVYVRRSLKDINKMIWDSPQIVQASASQDDSTCKSMSSILESIDTQHKPDIEPKPRTEPVIEPGANSAQDSAITSWDIPSRPVTFAYTFSGNFSYQQSRIPSRIPTLLSTQQAESVRATYRYPQSPWRTTTQYITRPPTYTPIDERALSRASSWA
ncbi:hypothetical protein GGI07_005302 [Coemansia sp. Benny D115]|nr:hypothetical protein GGI07_005302 [Coemansia sp. Benny D115]